MDLDQPCDGCGDPAVMTDEDGTPLCAACADLAAQEEIERCWQTLKTALGNCLIILLIVALVTLYLWSIYLTATALPH